MQRLLLTLMLLSVSTLATAKLSVFACEPEWAALAKEIGGLQITAFSAISAQQDPHYVRAKPSLIAALRKADLLICTGAGLEVGWLPVLIQSGGNQATHAGSPGYFMAAEVVTTLDKPASLDRSQGDIHPEGNPHLHLDPHNIALVAKALANRLEAIDVEHADYYKTQYSEFAQKWQTAIQGWEARAVALKGTPIVVHHSSFTYLFHWLGMEQVATLEPKPGIPPTSSHLETLLRTLSTQTARMIVRTPYDPSEASEWLAKKTAIPSIMLPYTVGGDNHSHDLFALFDDTLTLLEAAAHGQH